MTKIVILLSSATNKYTNMFNQYADTHQYERWEMYEETDSIEKVGKFISKIKDVCYPNFLLVIHNPSEEIRKLLENIDLITSELDFNIINLYLGYGVCPRFYDFVVEPTDTFEKQLDFIFNLEKENV